MTAIAERLSALDGVTLAHGAHESADDGMCAMERRRNADGSFARESIEQAFRSRTKRSGDCIEWTGRRDEKGYGRTSAGGLKNVGVHRVAWEEVNGPVPRGLCVLHRCDNPPCVNVTHLFLGTVADNNRDRAAKHRTMGFAAGERHPRSKVTDYQVEMIREMHRKGMLPRQIATMVDLSRSQVAKIVAGKARANAR